VQKAKKTKRDPIFLDEKYTGPEPTWDDPAITDEKFNTALIKAFNYYNYYYKGSDFRQEVVNWLEKNTELTVEQMVLYKASPDYMTPLTAAALVRMQNRGAPLRERHINFIKQKIQEAINHKKSSASVLQAAQKEEAGPAIKKPADTMVETIQTRILQQARDLADPLDGDVDQIMQGGAPQVNVSRFLSEKQVSKPVATKLRAFFSSELDEIKEAKEGKDEQLEEGYSNLKGTRLKKLFAWYEKTLSDIDSYIKVKQLDRKPRKRKAVPADKLVKNLKFLKTHGEFALVSVKPDSIIGSTQLWVFNVKTRKLGVYNAEFGATLSIKGTSIVNFDAVTSVAKTVRKPKEKCAELLKSSKIQLRKFMDGIKATQVKLTGRLNADTVLLRTQ
jgi:hypothetical protein